MRPILATLILATLPAIAEEREITPFIGWQEGGEIDVAGDPGPLDGALAAGVTLSFARERNSMLDLVLARQSTSAVSDDPFELRSIDLELWYAHVGGRVTYPGEGRWEPYIALTAGGTFFTFGGSEPTARLSFAGGVGTDVDLGRSTAVRLDARYYATLSGGSGEIACDSVGTCAAFAEGDLLTQRIVSAGLVVRF